MSGKRSPLTRNKLVQRADQKTRNVLINLVCGHRVKTRNPPMNPNAVFACSANNRCGYRVPWVSYTDGEGGFERPNRRYLAGKGEDGGGDG